MPNAMPLDDFFHVFFTVEVERHQLQQELDATPAWHEQAHEELLDAVSAFEFVLTRLDARAIEEYGDSWRRAVTRASDADHIPPGKMTTQQAVDEGLVRPLGRQSGAAKPEREPASSDNLRQRFSELMVRHQEIARKEQEIVAGFARILETLPAD